MTDKVISINATLETRKKEAVEMLAAQDLAGFVLIGFNVEGRVVQKSHASVNQMLVAEKIVNAMATKSLFDPDTESTGEPG